MNGMKSNLRSIEQNIQKSNILGFSRTLLAVPVYFLLTPYVINAIGKEFYGLWSLSTVVWTILSIGDFGFQNSLVHFTAMELDDHPKLSRLFNTAFFFFLAIAILFVTFVLVFNDFIIFGLLRLNPACHREATFVIVSSAIGFAVRFMAAPYQAIIEGNQRVYYSQKVSLYWLIFNALSTLVGLHVFPSIYTVGIISILGNVLVFGFFLVDARRKYSYVMINPKLSTISTLKHVFPYSVWIQLASILIVLREPLLKTIIARKYGLDGLASFEVVYRLTLQCMSFVVVPLLTTLPVTSSLYDRLPELRRIVKKYFMWVSGILIIPSIAVWFCSDFFIRLWLGNDFKVASSMLPWIFTAFAVYYLTEPLYKSVQGIGKSALSALSQGLFFVSLAILLSSIRQTSGMQPISYSLLIACILFSISNALIYKRIVLNVRGVAPYQ